MNKVFSSLLVSLSIILVSACGGKPTDAISIFKTSQNKQESEPFDFRGLKLGDSTEKFSAIIRQSSDYRICAGVNTLCIYDSWHEDRRRLRSPEDIGFGDIPARFGAFFGEKGGLYSLEITLNSDKFSEAAELLIAKFGKPTSSNEADIQNGMGNTFKNQTLYWERNGTSVTAERFSNKLTESKITYEAATREQQESFRQRTVREKAGKI